MIKLGKRCENIKGGTPCDFLCEDGTCLMNLEERPENCPARETVGNEIKDEWMLKRHFLEKPEKNVRL